MDPSRRNNGLGLGMNMPRNHSPVPPYDSGYTNPISPNPISRRSLSPLPPPPRSSGPPSPYSSTPPLYAATAPSTIAPSSVAPSLAPSATSSLPHFEAALARARGQTPPVVPSVHYAQQPLPSYLPPQDPNHPDLNVGFTQSHTIRLAQDSRYRREPSRSPSPGFDDSIRYNNFRSTADIEQGLLSDHERDDLLYGSRTPVHPPPSALSYMATGDAPDATGDLSLHGMGRLPTASNAGDRSSIYKAPLDGFEAVPLVEGQTHEDDDTQHFGPAPEGRVGRRTHNAIRKRVKQRITLDDSDMFSVEMPIPTRLAQFLPVKGVEEQKTTR